MATIEVEVDQRHYEMYQEMVEELGADVVEEEWTNLLQKSIYQTVYGSMQQQG